MQEQLDSERHIIVLERILTPFKVGMDLETSTRLVVFRFQSLIQHQGVQMQVRGWTITQIFNSGQTKLLLEVF